jgi:hypothetical protein
VPEIELGKVLRRTQGKSHPIDSSAAILYKAGKTIFKYDYEKGFYALHECLRIKIYKKRRVELGKF